MVAVVLSVLATVPGGSKGAAGSSVYAMIVCGRLTRNPKPWPAAPLGLPQGLLFALLPVLLCVTVQLVKGNPFGAGCCFEMAAQLVCMDQGILSAISHYQDIVKGTPQYVPSNKLRGSMEGLSSDVEITTLVYSADCLYQDIGFVVYSREQGSECAMFL